MKFVRKSIALLLALVMVLALSTAAFAAPVTEMQGVTLNYGIPSAYQFVRNNEAGAITKNVGDTGFYYRLPRSLMAMWGILAWNSITKPQNLDAQLSR